MKKCILLCVMIMFGVTPVWGFWGDAAIIFNQLIQINQSRRDLKMQLEQLKKLENITESMIQGMGSLSWDTIQKLLDSLYAGDEVDRLVTEISYDQNQVFMEYDNLFPSQSEWSSLSEDEQEAYVAQWVEELRLSRQNALLAQSKVTDYRNILRDILSYSDLEPTTEILLQQTNQILAIISNQLWELAEVVATGERAAITERSIHDFSSPSTYIFTQGESLDPEEFRAMNTPSYVENKPFSFEGFTGD